MSSAICGGVISETMHQKNVKRWGVWADTMAYIMPDVRFEKYLALKKAGKDKEATKIFERYARSQI
jgi:hypothetical protein